MNNSIATTGYLEQFANFEDLASFYEAQLPEAVGTNFSVVSVKGGLNNQSLEEAGAEANLDVQFAFGLSWPINVSRRIFLFVRQTPDAFHQGYVLHDRRPSPIHSGPVHNDEHERAVQ